MCPLQFLPTLYCFVDYVSFFLNGGLIDAHPLNKLRSFSPFYVEIWTYILHTRPSCPNKTK